MVGGAVLPARSDRGGRDLNAEIVGVGTELLLGQITNTNAQHISRALSTIGVDVYFHAVVGDNLERAARLLGEAMARSDAVIITGGLGPTPDDLTRAAVARATSRELVRDERLVTVIKEIFARMGREMPEMNLQQADLPAGATPIEPEGTAPGFFLEHGSTLVFALPGVPWEMKAMMEKTVLPTLQARSGDAVLVTRQILVLGLGESMTHERIADLVAEQTNPTIAFLAGRGTVRVRITAKARSEDEGKSLVEPVEREIRQRLRDHAVPGSRETIAQAVGDMLRERGLTLAAAESLTGGLIGSELAETPGASDFFLGSVVTYSTRAKHLLAGVDEALLEEHGAVSESAAAALAEGAARAFGADVAVSATGVAGPSEQEGKPVGTIFVGATHGGRTEVRHLRGYGDRQNIRRLAVTWSLDLARRLLDGSA